MADKNKPDAAPFCMTVQAVFMLAGKAVVAGSIMSGTLKAGQKVKAEGGRKVFVVEKIEIANKSLPSAQAGQMVGLTLVGADAAALPAGMTIKNAD
ncbi:Elongation factor Tu domain 4 [uncultured archaeon]|nr:Elongation factor Tu domain 4 [uncultured archaeon]